MVRIIENYTLYEIIGEGAYGKVYRATNKLDNRQYAVKVIEVKKFQSNKKLQQCTVNQINILTNIQKNQHIIAYYDMLKTQNNFYFIYQYCNGGTLEGMLRKSQMLDQKTSLLILKQLLQAFKLLNKYNIMHRDLKPDNIFFHNGVLKLGDFGFCKSLQKAKMTKTMLGSPIYMAPQILKGQIYSTKADIWSLGVVLYEMLYGYCPFQSTSIPKLIQVLNETQLEFPQKISVSIQTKNLLRKILTKDPTKRIEWMDLFQQKITNEGKLQKKERLSLIDDDNFEGQKPYRQVNQSNIQEKSNLSSSTNYGLKDRSQIYVSPRNVEKDLTFTKKPNYQIVNQKQQKINHSPMKKKKQSQIDKAIKQEILNNHTDILKGIGIIRNIMVNNDKHSVFFTFYMLRNILEKLCKLKQKVQQYGQLKQILNIINRQVSEIDIEINNLRGKVEDIIDWKRAMKIKIQEVRNIKICYEMVMFMIGETALDNLTHIEMQNTIRSKLIS